MSRKPVLLLAALFLAATAWLMLHHKGGTPAPRKEAVKPTRPKPTMAQDKPVTEPPPATDEVTLSAEQERMLAIAAEQPFNPNATKEGGLKPIPMTEELREELRKEGR
ncbi:MAG: hypothetical protein IPK22_12725 [Verrucomicrobiaceae bacterium]|nr:hypothetical protein [Verrucomicrobiaceae bacterium]